MVNILGSKEESSYKDLVDDIMQLISENSQAITLTIGAGLLVMVAGNYVQGRVTEAQQGFDGFFGEYDNNFVDPDEDYEDYGATWREVGPYDNSVKQLSSSFDNTDPVVSYGKNPLHLIALGDLYDSLLDGFVS